MMISKNKLTGSFDKCELNKSNKFFEKRKYNRKYLKKLKFYIVVA